MEHSNDLIAKLYQGPTKSEQTQCESSSISRLAWAETWSRLEAAGVVWEEVDSSTSEYWLAQLSTESFSEAELAFGCDQADNYADRSKITLGTFKKLCRPDKVENAQMYHPIDRLSHWNV